jgi:hypothetical protein
MHFFQGVSLINLAQGLAIGSAATAQVFNSVTILFTASLFALALPVYANI